MPVRGRLATRFRWLPDRATDPAGLARTRLPKGFPGALAPVHDGGRCAGGHDRTATRYRARPEPRRRSDRRRDRTRRAALSDNRLSAARGDLARRVSDLRRTLRGDDAAHRRRINPPLLRSTAAPADRPVQRRKLTALDRATADHGISRRPRFAPLALASLPGMAPRLDTAACLTDL